MPELRKDLLTGRRVIIVVERSKRSSDLKSIEESINLEEYNKSCPLCSGNEEMTPPETFRIESDGEWLVRAIPNKFPILSYENESDTSDEKYFEKEICLGRHEVLIESNKHNKNYFNLNKEEFINIFIMYKERYTELCDDESVQFVSLYKNFAKKAGASLSHTHAQIISMPIIPEDIQIELDNANMFYEENNQNIHKFIIEEELKKDQRVIHNGVNYLVIAPFASKYNFEIEIIFKNNFSFKSIKEKEIDELADIFHELFGRMKNVLGEFPFNMFLHSMPNGNDGKNKNYNTHIHITPRLSIQAGFELGTGIFVNMFLPESVADKLKF